MTSELVLTGAVHSPVKRDQNEAASVQVETYSFKQDNVEAES